MMWRIRSCQIITACQIIAAVPSIIGCASVTLALAMAATSLFSSLQLHKQAYLYERVLTTLMVLISYHLYLRPSLLEDRA